jgi:hypothetical protein
LVALVVTYDQPSQERRQADGASSTLLWQTGLSLGTTLVTLRWLSKPVGRLLVERIGHARRHGLVARFDGGNCSFDKSSQPLLIRVFACVVILRD